MPCNLKIARRSSRITGVRYGAVRCGEKDELHALNGAVRQCDLTRELALGGRHENCCAVRRDKSLVHNAVERGENILKCGGNAAGAGDSCRERHGQNRSMDSQFAGVTVCF